MKICDLHTHSNYSDGMLTPTELVREAAEKHIDALALTDHNTVDGLDEFFAAGEEYGIETVGGVELTCEYDGAEVHMLGLFVDSSCASEIGAFCSELARSKYESNVRLVRALAADGYEIDSIEEIYARSGHGNVNRAHIAESLITHGYVSSVSEAFAGILSPERGYYLPPKRPDATETVKLIKRLGGVAVIAHPYLNLTPEQLGRFLPEAIAAGLDGMETYYSKYPHETHALARETARRHGLLESGGSDYHGSRKADISLSAPDSFHTPYEVYLSLAKRAAR